MFKFGGKDKQKNEPDVLSAEGEENSGKLSERLKRSRGGFGDQLKSMFRLRRKLDDDLFEELETALLMADVGAETTMEIIEELEPDKRGIYSGAVGYIGWNGNMDTAIAIRTALIANGQLHIQAGAGIVADSVPRNEWQETMNKGRAIFRAVSMAADGLDLDAIKD